MVELGNWRLTLLCFAVLISDEGTSNLPQRSSGAACLVYLHFFACGVWAEAGWHLRRTAIPGMGWLRLFQGRKSLALDTERGSRFDHVSILLLIFGKGALGKEWGNGTIWCGAWSEN